MLVKNVEIHTDGACRGNPGPGGWAALLRYDDQQKHIYGAEKETTNNRMELTAAIKALESLSHRSRVKLVTDSQYLQKGISEWLPQWKARGWRTAAKQPVKNRDLWEMLDGLSKQHDISWHWVKAHNGHPDNEYVDRLANQAIDEM